MHRRVYLSILCLIFLLSTAICLQAATLAQKIDAVFQDAPLKYGFQGIYVKRLSDGKTIYAKNPDKLFMPASNMKLISASAILDKLGPDYTYETTVHISSALRPDGTLYGNVYLKGTGDPVLSTADISKMADALYDIGLRKVEGSVFADDTLFDTDPLGWHWSWDYLSYYFAPEISALNANKNVVEVYVRPGDTTGSPAKIVMLPDTGYMQVENHATTGSTGSKKDLSVFRKQGKNTVVVTGTVPLGYSSTKCEEPITVVGPAVFAGHILVKELSKRGVQVTSGVGKSKVPENALLVSARKSPDLAELLDMQLKPSDNLISEVFAKTLGAGEFGTGSWKGGTHAMRKFLAKAGVEKDHLRIADGSGLSRLNQVTPRSLVGLLTYMHKHKYSSVLKDALPKAGREGTLNYRFKGTIAMNRLMAKTGYIMGVSALSGYIDTVGGDTLAFSIILNNHPCKNRPAREAIDKICVMLCSLK